MAVKEKDIVSSQPSNVAGWIPTSVKKSASVAPTAKDGQDDALWDAAISNSIDAIREMAAKAKAERRAGKTRKLDF